MKTWCISCSMDKKSNVQSNADHSEDEIEDWVFFLARCGDHQRLGPSPVFFVFPLGHFDAANKI